MGRTLPDRPRMDGGTRQVAIACQGGGSHTAFTAGVLERLFANPPADVELVGLSGTSGGAMCAALAWCGWTVEAETPGPLLRDFWADLTASHPMTRWANQGIQWGIALHRSGVPFPDASPYHWPSAGWGQRALRKLLERHVDFDAVRAQADEADLALLVSAIDVLSGEFRIFRETELTVDALLASAAEPHLFRAVDLDGHHYWDGLFSKNPPIQDFMHLDDCPDPDEIWLIKINPQQRDRVPRTPAGIADRRNELSGNLSLNAEVEFIRQVNTWIEQGHLPDRYTHTDVRRIPFSQPDLDWRTKLDLSPAFIDELFEDGRRAAQTFLADRDEDGTE